MTRQWAVRRMLSTFPACAGQYQGRGVWMCQQTTDIECHAACEMKPSCLPAVL